MAPEKLLATVLTKTGGNLGAIQELGYGQRSMKMFEALAPDFQKERDRLRKEGKNEKQVNEGAGSFIQKKMEGLIGQKYSDKDLEQDFSTVMKSASEQFEQSVRQLKMEVGDKLIPEFQKLIPILQQLMPSMMRVLDGFVAVANWAANHPFAALTGALILSVTKAVATAGIGELIKKLLSGGGGGGAGGAGGGVGGALAAGAAAGAATYAVFNPVVEGVLSGQTKGQKHVGELASDLKNGTPEQKAAAAKEVREAQKQYGGVGGAIRASEGAQGAVVGLLNQLTGGKNTAAESLQKGAAGRQIAESKELAALVTALNNNTAAQGGGGKRTGTPDSASRETSIATRKGGAGHN